MKLVAVYFFEAPVIAAGKEHGSGVGRTDLRDMTTFHVDDGWDIDWDPSTREFRLYHDGMPDPVYVGATDYSRVEMPLGLHLAPDAPEPAKKGKR